MFVTTFLYSALKPRKIHYYVTLPAKTLSVRTFSSNYQRLSQKQSVTENAARRIQSKSTMLYVAAVGILTAGLSYAAVPLYRMFCQSYSYGGTVGHNEDAEKVEKMEKKPERIIKVKFNADLGASMRWNFRPQQIEIKVPVGETALAFYTAKNPTDVPVIGISTYNVVPFEAGQYFNKIQCFCFEEQQLNPHEQVDMPVFFYIDPEFSEDPKMEQIDTLILSYTFFEAKEGLKLPVPSFLNKLK